jgi:hypothetical protein
MANGRIDVATFATVLGAVVKQDRKEILTAIFTEDDPIIKACRTAKGVAIDNLYHVPTGSISEVAQGWNGPYFTHKGDIELLPSVILQFGHKLNVALYPTDLAGTYPGENGMWDEDADLKMQPFVRWALQNLIIRQLKEDHVLKQLYKGIYVDGSGTPTVAGDAADAMNGLKYILQNGDYSGEHAANEIGEGDLSDDPETLYEQLNSDVKEIDEKYRFTKPMELFMSPSKVQLYWEGRELVTGLRVRTDDGNRNMVPNTMIEIKGSHAMIGTHDYFITRPGNIVRLIDKSGIDGQIMVQTEDYQVKLLSNPYGLAYGFAYLEEVWTNVAAAGSGS